VTKKKKFFYGPVPSRRLGLSFGVDIVPFKVCTLDCVYCQLGKTITKTIERRDYGPIEPILDELRGTLDEGLETDFITIAGSGEPTLNLRLGELIDGIKKITNIPVAVLTNGTLFYQKDVRSDCAKADVVMPSLDAADEQTFQKVNRPHRDINIKNLISGLSTFRNEFNGQIWLEVFFIEGFNTDTEQISRIKNAIDRIRPDKIHLNTAVRPTAEVNIRRLDNEKLQAIAAQLGSKCEVVADFSLSHHSKLSEHSESDLIANNIKEALLSMLKRRPCSLDDICSGLGIGRNHALKSVTYLRDKGVIHAEEQEGKIFFKVR
jgi:wyosine [tRNA(Phe)-imidazoG37] synthetase (radical SAM superfamily)